VMLLTEAIPIGLWTLVQRRRLTTTITTATTMVGARPAPMSGPLLEGSE
jgi:hypothetical protein